MDYNNSYTQNSEPDYYEIYTRQQIKTAKGVFSRFHLGIFIYIIISFAVSLIAQIALLLIVGASGNNEFLAKHEYIVWILTFLCDYLIAFPVFYFFVKNMKTMPVIKSRMKPSEFFSLFLIAELAMWVGGSIGNIFNEIFAVIKGNSITDYTDEMLDSMPIWLTLIAVVIIGPIIEELIFRKLMIDRLSRYGSVVAIVVSSVSFGLYHGNLYQFFYATLVGVVLGFMYAKTRNVIYPILMHMLVNLFGSVLTTLVLEKSNELLEMWEAFAAGSEVYIPTFFANIMIVASYSIVQYAILVGGAFMLYRFIKFKRYKIRDRWEYRLPSEQTAGIIIANPGTILFIAVSVILIAYSIIIG